MKIALLFLNMFVFLFITGCNSMNNNSSENNLNSIKSTKNVSVVDNAVNTSVSQNKKINSNGFVTTNIEIFNNELTITYVNETDKIFSFGERYSLQFLKDNKWIDVPTLPNIGYNLVGIYLRSYKTFTDTIELKNIYGKLDIGHYRIMKEMDTNYYEHIKKMDNSIKFYAIGEFDIE